VTSPRSPGSNPESGYALLFVYAMAATVAVMLYMELPRVAFEAQREKEQLLIDRGEQYSRAVALYVRKFNRYPADFDALDNTQNLRFLRHHYTDPLTGKDEWRIIHVGPGGVFTDSLVYGKKKDDKKGEAQNFITELQQVGGNPVDPNQAANLATRRRPSDQPGAAGDPNNPSAPTAVDPNGQPVQNNPPPVQVLPDGRIVPVTPGQTGNPQQQATPGTFTPGAAFPQVGAQPQTSAQPIQGQPQTPLPAGLPGQQPNQPGQPPTAAANLINQLLTSPRPGGLNGINGQPTVDQFGNQVGGGSNQIGGNPVGSAPQQNPAANAQNQQNNTTGTPVANLASQGQNQTIGGGIAGVASKLEKEGIKIYRERSAYNEWEFVYDITKDSSRGGGAATPGQTNSGTSNPASSTQGTQTPTTPVTPSSQTPGQSNTPFTFPGLQPGNQPH
jgi:hypothetical protein